MVSTIVFIISLGNLINVNDLKNKSRNKNRMYIAMLKKIKKEIEKLISKSIYLCLQEQH